MTLIKNTASRMLRGTPVDDRMLKWTGAEYRPYSDAAEVIDTIIEVRRHKGLIVNIANVLYWFKDGVTDDDLIPFVTSGIITVKVDGEAGSPVVNEYTYQNDILIGRSVEYILVNKGPETLIDEDFTFNSATGTITRVNKWFDTPPDTALIFYQ